MPDRPLPLRPVGLLGVTVVAIAWLAFAPVTGRPVAAVFPPWWPPARGFAAAASAGVPITRMGGWPNILVTPAATPDLIARLKASGALFVLDGRSTGLCAVSE